MMDMVLGRVRFTRAWLPFPNLFVYLIVRSPEPVLGLFNADRYGVDLAVTHHLKGERFSLEGRIGCTGTGSLAEV